MGNETSAPEEGAVKPVVGYHVLRVNPSSPGSIAGLVPFFDFIVSVGDVPLEEEDSKLVDALQQNVGKSLTLGVFSSRTESVRYIELTPRNDWGGIGLLGVSIRFNSLKNAEEQVWHVELVYAKSPAQQAGLVSQSDYIVGTPDVLFSEEDDLYMLLRQATSVPLYVYSTVTDDIRIVNVAPNVNWGGNGVLGCELGYGLLHRIPREPAGKETKPVVGTIVVPAPKIDLTGSGPLVRAAAAPPPNHLAQHTMVHQHPVALAQQLPSNNLVQHPAPHQQLPSSNLVQHPALHQQLASNNLVQHPQQQQVVAVGHNVVTELPSNVLVQHPAPHQQLPSNNLVQHPDQQAPISAVPQTSIRIPESPIRMNSNEIAPQEPAPQAPATPVKITVEAEPAAGVVAAPPSSSGKSLDDHKKKLAALQAKMNELRK
jgi:hypothetical protein